MCSLCSPLACSKENDVGRLIENQSKKKQKIESAPAGNRTRVYRVAGGNSTTRPPAHHSMSLTFPKWFKNLSPFDVAGEDVVPDDGGRGASE